MGKLFDRAASFLKSLLSPSGDEASMKRFIVLIISFFYMLSSLCILFGFVRPSVNQEMLQKILDDCFIVILTGLGAITIANIGDILGKRFDAFGKFIGRREKPEEKKDS